MASLALNQLWLNPIPAQLACSINARQTRMGGERSVKGTLFKKKKGTLFCLEEEVTAGRSPSFKAGSSLNSKKTLDKCEVSPLGPSTGCVWSVAQTLVLYTWCEVVLYVTQLCERQFTQKRNGLLQSTYPAPGFSGPMIREGHSGRVYLCFLRSEASARRI